jgi:hypothetical protein
MRAEVNRNLWSKWAAPVPSQRHHAVEKRETGSKDWEVEKN